MKVAHQIAVLGSPESLTWDPHRMRNPRFKKSTQTQSIIFPRETWTVDAAKKWLRSHGKKAPAVDQTKDFLRFRQEDPDQFDKKTFRTIPLGRSGIKSIIGVSKKVRNPEISQTSFLSRAFFMCCNESCSTLFLIDGIYATEIDRPSGLTRTSAFSLWSGFQPDNYYQFDLPDYELKKGGEAVRICYQSDKWDGKLTHYFHDFIHAPKVWFNKDRTIWAIKHQTSRNIVSAEGIIG